VTGGHLSGKRKGTKVSQSPEQAEKHKPFSMTKHKVFRGSRVPRGKRGRQGCLACPIKESGGDKDLCRKAEEEMNLKVVAGLRWELPEGP
jgi:hypothetical protein